MKYPGNPMHETFTGVQENETLREALQTETKLRVERGKKCERPRKNENHAGKEQAFEMRVASEIALAAAKRQ
jgi:hypothetical protein